MKFNETANAGGGVYWNDILLYNLILIASRLNCNKFWGTYMKLAVYAPVLLVVLFKIIRWQAFCYIEGFNYLTLRI